MERYRRPREREETIRTGSRVASKIFRHIREERSETSEGNPTLRTPWNGKDSACESGSKRKRSQLHQHQRTRTTLKMGWRIREWRQRNLQKGPPGSAHSSLLRRNRRHRPSTRQRIRRYERD